MPTTTSSSSSTTTTTDAGVITAGTTPTTLATSTTTTTVLSAVTTDPDLSHNTGVSDPTAETPLAFTGDASTNYALGALLIMLGGGLLLLAGVAASDRIRDLLSYPEGEQQEL